MYEKKRLLTIDEFEKEAQGIFIFLNFTLGLGLFLYTITAIQFDSPWKINLIGLIIWMPCFYYAAKLPKSLIAIREIEKEAKNSEVEEVEEIRKQIGKWYAWRLVTSAPIFWIGFIFYMGVLIYPIFPDASWMIRFLQWLKC